MRDAAPELDAGPDTDLTIACSMPGSISGAGETIQVAYEIGNLATVSGAAGFHIAVQMAHGDPGTFESVADTPYVAVLMPGSTDSGDISFVAPAWIRPGENPLRCVVDSANDVAETDETNNTADMSLVATALPDLTIPYANFTLVPCGTFTVTFDVQNTGVVVASGPFNWNISGGDGSAGGTLASGTISGLDAGATQRITTDATDPSGALYGAGSVSIRVDPTAGGMDRVSESDEGNNLSSRSVTWCGG